jgi:hypothetical protein
MSVDLQNHSITDEVLDLAEEFIGHDQCESLANK